MDPVTHLTAGALGGRLARARFDKRQMFWFCVAAALFPDIDNLAGIFGPEFYLRYHRGITHSFFGGLVLALLLAGGFKLFSRSFPFVAGFLIGYATIAVHIFLDLITSYGTLIFSPLTSARYSINAIFIIDPIYIIAIILFLVSIRVWKKHATRIAIAGLGWVLVYPMLCFAVNRSLTAYYEERFEREGRAFTAFEITTEPFSPFLWKLVAEDEERYYLAGIKLLDLDRDLEFDDHLKPPPDLVEKLEQKISMLATFLWFARYPIMRTEHSPAKKSLVFNDLRFFLTAGFLENSSRNHNPPFGLTIELDNDGNPLNWQYNRPRGTVVIHYIE